MANLIKKTEYGQLEKHILIANNSYMVSLPARIAATGAVTVDGKKIIKAGTPLAGDITKRGTAFAKASTGVTAIALHDVDVTAGEANGTILLAGCVDKLKLDSDVQSLITSTVVTALSRIIFVEGSAI